MPQTPKQTLWLRSRMHTNLCVELAVQQPTASHSLRRATANVCISLPAFKQVDLCKVLDMDREAARAVVARSPQVQEYLRRAKVALIDDGT